MAQGVIPTPEAYRRISAATRAYERSPQNQGTGRGRLGERSDEIVALRNTEAVTMPQYGLGAIAAWDTTDHEFDTSYVAVPGDTRLAIATGAIAAAGVGMGWTSGIRRVLCSAYASVDVGDRLGAVVDSWYAAALDIGPLLVVGDVQAIEQPAGLPAGVGLVLVNFDRWRP